MERSEAHGFSAAMSGAFLLSCLLFAAVNRHQRGPYMDEAFHVPQAQAYCRGRFLQVARGGRSGSAISMDVRWALWKGNRLWSLLSKTPVSAFWWCSSAKVFKIFSLIMTEIG